MKSKNILTATVIAGLFATAMVGTGLAQATPPPSGTREITRAVLLDRIGVSWVGMLIGGLEGLPHELKSNGQPRATQPDFIFLTNGSINDDDNDFEWTHLWFMDRGGVRVAERIILAHGGERITVAGQPGYRIKLQSPKVLERLPVNPHGPQNQP